MEQIIGDSIIIDTIVYKKNCIELCYTSEKIILECCECGCLEDSDALNLLRVDEEI